MITRKFNTLVKLCLLCVFTCHLTLSEEIAEFQYPCYVDVCTFPRQFCNSDKYEKRCSPCSTSLCSQNRIPLACKYQCNLINNPTKPTSVTAANTNPPIENSESEVSSLYLIVAYNAVLTTLFVITLLLSASCYVRWKRKKVDQVQDADMVPLNQHQANERAPGLPVVICPNCRNIRDTISTPPPYKSTVPIEDQQVNVETGSRGGAVGPRCRPELVESETQTAPKSADLSFEFNNTESKSEFVRDT